MLSELLSLVLKVCQTQTTSVTPLSYPSPISTHISIPAWPLSHRIPCPPLPPGFCSLLPCLAYFSIPSCLLPIFQGSAQTLPLPRSLPSLAELRMTHCLWSSPFLRIHIKIVVNLAANSANQGSPGDGVELALEYLTPHTWYDTQWIFVEYN